MTFVADERARVPFALIAAVLLVSTLTYTSGFVHETPEEPVVPRLVEEAEQQARMQLGTTARGASRAAARAPLQTVATTPLGRVMADDPFVSALELRIAVRARDSIVANRSADGARVAVSVAPIESTADARRALRTVTVTHLDGERYRVSLSNVSVAVSRDGRVVERDTVTLETTVALPAVAVHRRAQRFEHRLEADLRSPGLHRGLTARLFALAWVRGYAQYGGAPISNVVANRHVGVLTNDALVDQQVAAFGRADPDARRDVARASASVAVADGVRGAESIVSSAMETPNANGSTQVTSPASLGAASQPSLLDDPQSVDVDQTADAAFVAFVDGSGLDRALASAYRASVRPSTSARQTGYEVSHDGERPANGSERFSYTTTDRDVTGTDRSPGSGSTLLEYDRTVTVTETEHTYWTVNRTFAGTTSRSVERTYAVTVDVDCRYDRPPGAPGGRMASACPFGERARADLEREAADAMRTRFGGVDDVARAAPDGGRDHRWTTVSVTPPPAARERAYRSTATLRETVRGVSVEMPPASMASTANPASRLRETLQNRQDRLVDAPSHYRSAAGLASAVARDDYLDAVEGDLRGQSNSFAGVQDALGDVMAANAVPASPPERDPDALPPIASGVDAEPRYLSLTAREEDPNLAARNVNVFTVPYGDAADTVGAAIGGDEESDETVSLSTAASTLAATDRALDADADATLRAERDRLRRGVQSSLDAIREEQRRALRSSAGLSATAARRAVASGYRHHDTVASRAQAVVDGTIATDIAAALPADVDAATRDRAAVELRVATTDARSDERVRLSESAVSPVTAELRSQVREGVEQSVRVGTHRAATLGKRRAMRSAASEIPAGLPLLPVPGQWYATANVWAVSVRGGYDRFTVRTPRAAPVYGRNGTISYVREDAPVRLDVDGDGRPETLGRNAPIELSADTGVFVVVPPGSSGVGDTDGNADERSPGW